MNKERMWTIVWFALILLLLSLYILVFFHLRYGLQSIFDEGFYYICYKPVPITAIPLSLTSDVIKAIFPTIDCWDVLTLRRAAFGIKGGGILVLLSCSLVFASRERGEKSKSSLLALVACILLVGLSVMPSVVINCNDILLVFGMVVLSFSLLSVSFDVTWVKLASVGGAGLFTFLAMLCSVPGGFMLGLLSFLFLVFYNGFEKRKMLITMAAMFIGLVLGVFVMHIAIIRLHEFTSFFEIALNRTKGSGSTHSLTQLAVQMLFNIRDLIMTVTVLCGISYLCGLIQRRGQKRWLTVIMGILLFVILYKWQVKPAISFASIVTWLMLMTCVVCGGNKGKVNCRKDVVLVLYLFLLPLGLALGSNLGILSKAPYFLVPWGVLFFFLSQLTRNSSRLFSNGILVFVFAFFLYGDVQGLVRWINPNTAVFEKEYPIARMRLNENQYAFYNEVYDVLEGYDYKSRQDTVLGFCYNEMTIVAVDAVPYTSDQLPEEFLIHSKEDLAKPAFMILTEWDEKMLKDFFESLDWDFPDSYDCYKLVNNPDPNSGYYYTQSSVYCLKDRRRNDEK